MVKREDIVKEITSIDTSKLKDKKTFAQMFNTSNRLTTIEQLLFYIPAKKYYYNYGEGRLRYIEMELKKMVDLKKKDDTHFMTCKDVLGDWDDLHIYSSDFSNKSICFMDRHKVITHDPKTGHYECFYVAMEDDKIRAIFQSIKSQLPPELRKFIGEDEDDVEEEKPKKGRRKKKVLVLPPVDNIPEDAEDDGVRVDEEEVIDDEDDDEVVDNVMEEEKPDLADHAQKVKKSIVAQEAMVEETFEFACSFIANYLLHNTDEITAIKFKKKGEKIKIDMVTSKVFMSAVDDDDDEDDEEEEDDDGNES